MTDKMYIRDLETECVIGTKVEERHGKQKIVLNLVLECDLAPAGESDRLDSTVNYMDLKNEIVAFVEQSEYFLIERLADRIAEICLRRERVTAVTVTVDKPEALVEARSVAVEIRRKKG